VQLRPVHPASEPIVIGPQEAGDVVIGREFVSRMELEGPRQ